MLALIGDKILDIIYYGNSIRSGVVAVGEATSRRGILMSNASLSMYVDRLSCKIVDKAHKDVMSQREKATAIEACIGAAFDLDGHEISPRVRAVAEDVIAKLSKNQKSSTFPQSSPFVYDPGLENARTKFSKAMQALGDHRRLEDSCTFTESNQRHSAVCSMPELGKKFCAIKSKECDSKSAAIENIAIIILERLHKQFLADNKHDKNIG